MPSVRRGCLVGWGMNKVTKSLLSGFAAFVLLAGGYAVLLNQNISVPADFAVIGLIALVFGATVSLFALTVQNLPAKKLSGAAFHKTKLSALPPPEKDTDRLIVTPIPHMEHAWKLVVRPDTTAESLLEGSEKHREEEAFVTVRKTSEKSSFNPLQLRDIFSRLKDNENPISVLLRDEHNEFAGYIPGPSVRRFFVDNKNSESEITHRIINALSNTKDSSILRQIDGVAATDWISDEATVEDAAKRMTRDQLKGLVVLQGGRHRNPVALVYLDDLAAAMIKFSD